jgi:hypothetical protein
MAAESKASDQENIPDIAMRIMERMARLPPKPHRVAPKPATPQGEAQRRRREKERKLVKEQAKVAGEPTRPRFPLL